MEENPKVWPFKWKLPTEQYFSMILFINRDILLNNVVAAFGSVGGVILCDHSDESYWAVVSRGSVYCAVQDSSNFWVCQWIKYCGEPFKQNHLSSTFMYTLCFSTSYKWNLGFIMSFGSGHLKGPIDRKQTNKQTNPVNKTNSTYLSLWFCYCSSPKLKRYDNLPNHEQTSNCC